LGSGFAIIIAFNPNSNANANWEPKQCQMVGAGGGLLGELTAVGMSN